MTLPPTAVNPVRQALLDQITPHVRALADTWNLNPDDPADMLKLVQNIHTWTTDAHHAARRALPESPRRVRRL